jgi:uncharacterized protein YecT (DUF1311 family)
MASINTKPGRRACAKVLALSALWFPLLRVRGEDPAFQTFLEQKGNELNAAYQTCLARFSPAGKEQLRIAERAWIVFDNKDEEAIAIVGKRRGMSEEDLDRAEIPETISRTAMLHNFFLVPNEDIGALQQNSESAERELTEVYKESISKLAPDEERKLRDAERAWIDYRDKDVRAHFGDPSGRAPIWASAVIARRRTFELRSFYLQQLASLPAPSQTPAPTPTAPPMDPGARAKLVAEFKAAAQGAVTKGAAAGPYVEYTSLNAVKALPSALTDEITALEDQAAAFRAKLDAANQLGGDCRLDLDSADALGALRDAVQDITAADTPAASEKLSAFHERGFSPETAEQKLLGKSLNSLWTICDHLKEQAHSLCERAKAAADAGKSAEAIKDYQDAYKIYPDPDVAQTIKRLREDSLGL